MTKATRESTHKPQTLSLLSNLKQTLAALQHRARLEERVAIAPSRQMFLGEVWSRLATNVKINVGKFKWQYSEHI